MEILGRELSFAVKDAAEISDGSIKWKDSNLSLQGKKLAINFYVKSRTNEFCRALGSQLAILEENMESEELMGSAQAVAKEELPPLLARLWWLCNLDTGVNATDLEEK